MDVTFSDITIKPQMSYVMSRSDVDLTSDMGEFKLTLPIISANMKYITGPKMCIEMYNNGGMGILHRFNSIENAVSDYKEVSSAIENLYDSGLLSSAIENLYDSGLSCGVSIGVKELDKERFDKLYEAGARIFCIDVAHGHHVLVKNMIKWIKDKCLGDVCIIAGNIATSEASQDLQEWGANILKVGIGPGSCCETRKNTGVGVPQFSAVQQVSACAKIPIIADGGIVYPGDVAKALIYADTVMVAGIIAGSTETPGHVYKNERGEFYKVYGGNASGENKVENGQEKRFVEGIIKLVPFRGHIKYILRDIKEGLQSALSLSGASNLKEFRSKVKWEIMSFGSQKESKI